MREIRLRNIRLTKLSGEVPELDLYDLLRKGQPLLTPLSDGDTIYTFGWGVGINGEVKRPARYEVGANSTIADLIEMAGGPTERAYSRGLSCEDSMQRLRLSFKLTALTVRCLEARG